MEEKVKKPEIFEDTLPDGKKVRINVTEMKKLATEIAKTKGGILDLVHEAFRGHPHITFEKGEKPLKPEEYQD